MMTLAKCPLCLQTFEDMTEEGFENHKKFCREREFEEIRHRQEVADTLNQFRPMTLKEASETLGVTVKRDQVTKTFLLAGMLLTYTEQEQLNILMAAESSAGKSYLPLEIAAYFPSEDVQELGSASPTSFFHEVAGSELAEWDAEHKIAKVHLENKIMIFLDQPHDQLLQKLRAFLSHDKKEIRYKHTDRSQKSGLRTRTVILIGFPTWIFCTAAFNLDQQERTRNLQLSPETSPDKVKEAQRLLLRKKSNRDAFRDFLQEDPKRQELRERILGLKDAKIRDVVIPDTLTTEIERHWEEKHTISIPRHVRDLDRFLSLVKARALLNYGARKQIENNRIEATLDDLEEVIELYGQIAQANELGIAPQVYEIFAEVFCKFPNGADKRDILKEYFAVFHRPLSQKRLEKEVLPALEASGLVDEAPDPSDKRRITYYPHPLGYISSPETENKQNTPEGGGRVQDETLEAVPLLHPQVKRTSDIDAIMRGDNSN